MYRQVGSDERLPTGVEEEATHMPGTAVVSVMWKHPGLSDSEVGLTIIDGSVYPDTTDAVLHLPENVVRVFREKFGTHGGEKAAQADLLAQILAYLKFRVASGQVLEAEMAPNDSQWTASHDVVVFEVEKYLWQIGRYVCVAPQPIIRRFILERLYDAEATAKLGVIGKLIENTASGFIDPKVAGFAAKYLERSGYIKRIHPFRNKEDQSAQIGVVWGSDESDWKSHENNMVFEITGRGIQQVEQWRRVIPGKAVGFAIMAFCPETQRLWEEAVRPALEKLRLAPIRIDEVTLSEPIIDAIHRFIAQADLVFADLSWARPNCYYEVGVARAMGKKTVLTVRKDQFPDGVHFDASAYQIEPWTDGELPDLQTRLVQRGQAALSETTW